MSSPIRSTESVPPIDSDSSETLTSRVYAWARADVIAGRLKPGAKLKIEELRERYDVGASPLREALSLLSSDGLVERIEQRGFRVANVSQEEFSDILKVRCWLEERALRESIAHGHSDWEEALVLAGYRLSRQPRSKVPDGAFISNDQWEARHKEFHMALIAACGSPTLLNYCKQLYDQNIRYRHVAGAASYPQRDVANEHEEILQATLNRDVELATSRLISHYTKTGAFLTEVLKA
ncbi:MAG: GntR family transcriptional regulator [Hyphomicrobiaceae bacterium]